MLFKATVQLKMETSRKNDCLYGTATDERESNLKPFVLLKLTPCANIIFSKYRKSESKTEIRKDDGNEK